MPLERIVFKVLVILLNRLDMEATFKLLMTAKRHSDTSETVYCVSAGVCMCTHTHVCTTHYMVFVPLASKCYCSLPLSTLSFLPAPNFCHYKSQYTWELHFQRFLPCVCATPIRRRKMREQLGHSSVQLRHKSNNIRSVHRM